MGRNLNKILPKDTSIATHQICQRQRSTNSLHQLRGIYAISLKPSIRLRHSSNFFNGTFAVCDIHKQLASMFAALGENYVCQ